MQREEAQRVLGRKLEEAALELANIHEQMTTLVARRAEVSRNFHQLTGALNVLEQIDAEEEVSEPQS